MITSDSKSPRDYPVDRLIRLFIQTGNPVFAWQAYKLARKLNVGIPEEVLKYLDISANNILKIANDPPVPKKRPAAIAVSLDLSGNKITEYESYNRKRSIAIETIIAIDKANDAKKKHEEVYLRDIFDSMAQKYKISAPTARRHYHEFREYCKREAQYLIDSGILKLKGGRLVYELIETQELGDYIESEIIFYMAKERLNI